MPPTISPIETNTHIHTPLPSMGYPVVSIYITRWEVWSSSEMEIPRIWCSIKISPALLYWTLGGWYLISFNIMYLFILYLLCCKLKLSTATTKILFPSFQHKTALLHSVIKMRSSLAEIFDYKSETSSTQTEQSWDLQHVKVSCCSCKQVWELLFKLNTEPFGVYHQNGWSNWWIYHFECISETQL